MGQIKVLKMNRKKNRRLMRYMKAQRHLFHRKECQPFERNNESCKGKALRKPIVSTLVSLQRPLLSVSGFFFKRVPVPGLAAGALCRKFNWFPVAKVVKPSFK